MDGRLIAFVIWTMAGCLMIGIGISAFFKKTAMGFWANVKQKPVNDVKNYNYAVGKLFIVYGIILILLGMPLLMGQNSPFVFLSVIGTMIETIIMMIVYILVIEKKYR